MPKKEDFFLPDSVDILGFEVVGRKLVLLKSGPQLCTVMIRNSLLVVVDPRSRGETKCEYLIINRRNCNKKDFIENKNKNNLFC